MEHGRDLVIKVAVEPWELEQVYRLNYRTFVEEIPQHPPNPRKALVDRFLARSTCFICLQRGRLLGMVAVSDERPFSLDVKLPDLDSYLPPASRPCEVRLLAVEGEHRGGPVFGKLLSHLIRYCWAQKYDLALISAATSQVELYRHLGFRPFGPSFGSEPAVFQGMFISWNLLTESAWRLLREDRGWKRVGGHHRRNRCPEKSGPR